MANRNASAHVTSRDNITCVSDGEMIHHKNKIRNTGLMILIGIAAVAAVVLISSLALGNANGSDTPSPTEAITRAPTGAPSVGIPGILTPGVRYPIYRTSKTTAPIRRPSNEPTNRHTSGEENDNEEDKRNIED